MQNASISGSGSIIGGKYDRVSIAGSGKINGDVEALVMKIAGSGKVAGDALVETFKISGSGGVEGSFTGKTLHVSGSGKVGGPMQVSEMKVSGSFTCQDNLVCHTLNSSGALKVLGDVESEWFKSSGSFHVGGLINANDMQVRVEGSCYAREIGGETIMVRGSASPTGILVRLYRWLFGGKIGQLRSDLIEGTEVYVEETEAKMIRGNKIVIGPNCRIEKIEFSDSLDVHVSSVVLSENKI